ncbi:hypothetical protein [Urbifossiella limnaea]|uniref:Uncharacterized protein n=1 Tax=Urbifossiella limnaea TaxID=2528023 RepID=A0A517XQE5_9BACT|nr:hypothetical protein [Urbifossiella limnaea]QDU19722.1 hypothetical protein ETAA1_16580 [Urbifossiella limnaea]
MAGRTLSRRALRDEHDHVEADASDDTVDDDDTSAPAKKPRARKTAAKAAKVPKVPAKPRVRKRTAKVPPRMVARWAVCDGGLKRVAVFEYRDRVGADARLAEYRERKTGTYCLQLVKDPYEPPAAAV